MMVLFNITLRQRLLPLLTWFFNGTIAFIWLSSSELPDFFWRHLHLRRQWRLYAFGQGAMERPRNFTGHLSFFLFFFCCPIIYRCCYYNYDFIVCLPGQDALLGPYLTKLCSVKNMITYLKEIL